MTIKTVINVTAWLNLLPEKEIKIRSCWSSYYNMPRTHSKDQIEAESWKIELHIYKLLL